MANQQLANLVNDRVVNVAQLLKHSVGESRTLDVHLDQFPLDTDLRARDVDAGLRLTRIATGILVNGQVQGFAGLQCVRCLTEFEQSFRGEFDAEFRPSIDVRTGEPLPLPQDDETFVIDHNHQMDLTEMLRQVIIISLPMRPVCGDVCPGFEAEHPAGEKAVDDRLAILANLLDEAPD